MSKTIIEILIDKSGSMGFMEGDPEAPKYLIDGKTRMSIIKRILTEEVIPIIDFAALIIVRYFRIHNEQKGTINVETPVFNCIYKDKFNEQVLREKIERLTDPPSGGTPIAQAIETAIVDLKNYEDYDRKIILLTDGEENGGGDYKQAAKRALELPGIPCRIFVIGLNQAEEAVEKSKEIATGGYINITTSSYNSTHIKNALAALKTSVIQSSIVAIQSQPITEMRTEILQTLEEKKDTIKQESKKAAAIQIDELEKKIKEQIQNSQNLLNEITSLKELIKVNLSSDDEIDSTTLTLDPDYSEDIRSVSEKFLYEHLCKKHGAQKIKWLNAKGESYSHHDFELVDDTGKTIQFIECKGTPKSKATFYMTSDEWYHFLDNKDLYQLYRVFNVGGIMQPFCIDNLFTSILAKQVVPYLLRPERLKEGRVFLTLTTTQ